MIRELGSFDERKSGRVGALEGGVPCLTSVRIPAPGTGGEILPPEHSETSEGGNQEPGMIYVLLGVIITV